MIELKSDALMFRFPEVTRMLAAGSISSAHYGFRTTTETIRSRRRWFAGFALLLGLPSIVLTVLQSIQIDEPRLVFSWLGGSVVVGLLLMWLFLVRAVHQTDPDKASPISTTPSPDSNMCSWASIQKITRPVSQWLYAWQPSASRP